MSAYVWFPSIDEEEFASVRDQLSELAQQADARGDRDASIALHELIAKYQRHMLALDRLRGDVDKAFNKIMAPDVTGPAVDVSIPLATRRVAIERNGSLFRACPMLKTGGWDTKHDQDERIVWVRARVPLPELDVSVVGRPA